jgi:hypothetical protein
MRQTSVAVGTALAALLAAASTNGAELELAGYVGYTLPFYEQTFPIDLRPPSGAIQGIELRQVEPLKLNAKGALTLAGGATLFFGPLGIEGRYDSAKVDPTADPPVYSLRLSSPFPSLTTTLAPSPTAVSVSHLTPLSLNLKLRSAVGFSISGGVSYLPDFELAVRQPLNLRIGGAGLPGLDLGSVTAEAVSRPQDPSRDSRFGANLGVGLRIPVSDHAGLVVDARAFYFPEQVLEWRVAQTGGPVTLPPALVQSIAQQLEPVRFNPAYFHLQGGLALSF